MSVSLKTQRSQKDKLNGVTGGKRDLANKRSSDRKIDEKQMKIFNYFGRVQRNPSTDQYHGTSGRETNQHLDRYADVEKLVSQLVGATVYLEKLKLSDCAFKKASCGQPLYKVVTLKTSIFNMMAHYCPKCNKQFPDADRDEKICEICKTLLLFQCLRCDTRYSNLSDAKHHLKSKCNPIEFYDCSYCTYNCSVKKEIYEHLRKAHVKIYEYSRSSGGTSSFDFGEGVAFVKKMKFNVLNMAKRYCLKCDERMDLRTKICENCDNFSTTLQCLKCSKVYSDINGMKYHLESSCNSINSFQCNRCPYITRVKQLMRRHLKKCHERECSFDYSYSSASRPLLNQTQSPQINGTGELHVLKSAIKKEIEWQDDHPDEK